MDKIVFKDFPNTETPIDADNLNLLQENIEKAIKGIVLYNDVTGTTGTITLNETSANFTYLEIFYYSAGGGNNSVKIYQPNGSTAYLNTNAVNIGVSYFQNKIVSISGTNITNVVFNQNVVGSGEVSTQNNNNIYIKRVVGFK